MCVLRPNSGGAWGIAARAKYMCVVDLSRTEVLPKVGTCARDWRALQQLALNVPVKHSDLTWCSRNTFASEIAAPVKVPPPLLRHCGRIAKMPLSDNKAFLITYKFIYLFDWSCE